MFLSRGCDLRDCQTLGLGDCEVLEDLRSGFGKGVFHGDGGGEA
jgi:hypothetical protein